MARNHEPGMPAKRGGTNGNGGVRSKYRQRGGDSKVLWDFAESDKLLAAIVAATEAGDAVMFAKSRDGGVLVCTVFSGEFRDKYYWGTEQEVNKGLLDIIEANAIDQKTT